MYWGKKKKKKKKLLANNIPGTCAKAFLYILKIKVFWWNCFVQVLSYCVQFFNCTGTLPIKSVTVVLMRWQALQTKLAFSFETASQQAEQRPWAQKGAACSTWSVPTAGKSWSNVHGTDLSLGARCSDIWFCFVLLHVWGAEHSHPNRYPTPFSENTAVMWRTQSRRLLANEAGSLFSSVQCRPLVPSPWTRGFLLVWDSVLLMEEKPPALWKGPWPSGSTFLWR